VKDNGEGNCVLSLVSCLLHFRISLSAGFPRAALAFPSARVADWFAVRPRPEAFIVSFAGKSPERRRVKAGMSSFSVSKGRRANF
jgi:hypothetical protein